jgi:hypothetical protein
MFALRFLGTFIPFYLTLKGNNKLGSWTLTSNPYGVLSVVLKTGGKVVGQPQWPGGSCGIYRDGSVDCNMSE